MISLKNKALVFVCIMFCSHLFSLAQVAKYKDDNLSVEKRVNEICRLMTLEEKADFLAGKDLWHFKGIGRLGIPPLQMTDCGHGVTVVFDKTGNWVGNATCFPTAVAQAATWNRSLIEQTGSAIAREAIATGSSILLAPMVNIKRSPLNGRNYETFSEDPLLTGEMATAFINGVQSEHVGAVIKAIACNNQQAFQEDLMVYVDERTLQEIYLHGFRIAIKKARPLGIMSAYNGLNGDRCSDSKHLLVDIVRKDWGYNGFIVSDWRAVKRINSLYNGLDIEMPGPGKIMTKENVLKAVNEKKLSVKELDEKVKHLLKAYVMSTLVDADKPVLNAEINSSKHQMLARKVSEEGIVLLKNKNNLLPFDFNKIKKLAVIGPNATQARLGGGGSASVSPFYSVSPLDGLRNVCSDKVKIVFEEGCGLNGNLKVIDNQYLRYFQANGKQIDGLKADYFNNPDLKGTPDVTTIDELVNFSWGWANPKPGIQRNDYSVRWEGQLIPPATGEYKLGFSAGECGYRFYIDGKLMIDEWGTGGKDNFEAHFNSSNRQIAINLEKDKPVDIRIEFYKRMNRNFFRFEWEIPGESSLELALNAAKTSDAVVIFAGLSNFFEGGAHDREDITLPGDQNRLISEVAKVNPNTVVVLINGSAVSMPWVNEVGSVLEAYYPGQEGGNAIANVLSGKVNPSGKLVETFPVKLSDNPSFGNFPGENNQVTYTEGIYVGYRHYDTKNVTPLFPFGHGLSYTTFDYSDLEIANKGKDKIISFKIKNMGEKDGAEVAQLYISDLNASEDRPVKELKNFEKIFLKAGEEKTVTMELKKEELEFFSKINNKWIFEPGKFEVLIGSSSRDIRLKNTFTVK